ncbi:MAG: dihydrolipoamide acetyltransferase [Deltaproteobacteria bacterium]|nr:dihydrolipoamide acetyltransferase [Deltaproteobacteria bacterium]
MTRMLTTFVCLFALGAAAAGTAPPPPPPAAAAPTTTTTTTPAAPAAAVPVPAAAAPVVPAAAEAAPPAAGITADHEYGLKMKELEDSVAELKEQIFRSKAKLTLLTEQVQGGTGAGSRIVITHKNQLGANFLLVEVDYFLDGTPLWQEVDDTGAKLTPMKEHPLWDGNIIEGSHTLSVELKYKGNGTGVWQYLSGYSWKLKDSLTFTAEAGKLVSIDVVGFEKGNFTTDMTERPAIRFDQNVQADRAAKGKAK